MNNIERIKDEIGLVIYFNNHRQITYEKIIEWAAGTYEKSEIISQGVNGSSCYSVKL